MKIVFASHPDIKERIKMKPHDLIRGKKYMEVGEEILNLIEIL